MVLRERETLTARIESEQAKVSEHLRLRSHSTNFLFKFIELLQRQVIEQKLVSNDSSSSSLKRKYDEMAEENKRLKTIQNSWKRKCEEYSEELKKLKKRLPLTNETTPARNVILIHLFYVPFGLRTCCIYKPVLFTLARNIT